MFKIFNRNNNNNNKYSIIFKNTTVLFKDVDELYTKLKSIAIDTQEIYEWLNRYIQIIAMDYIDTIDLGISTKGGISKHNRERIFNKTKILVSCLHKVEEEKEEDINSFK